MKTTIATIILAFAFASQVSAGGNDVEIDIDFDNDFNNSNNFNNNIDNSNYLDNDNSNENENDNSNSLDNNIDARTSFNNQRAASSSASLYSAQCKKEASGQGMAFGFAVASVEGFCTSYLVWDKLTEMCRLEPIVNVLVQDEVVEETADLVTSLEPPEPTYSYQNVTNPKCADADKMYKQTMVEYEGIVGAKQWRAIGRKYVPFLFTILPL